MTYEDWEQQVPKEFKDDTVWLIEAYRLSLFVSDLAWVDSDKLFKNRKTRNTADQLLRVSSNIGSNICEGYSRDTGKGRATFYEYALGSARESRGHYYNGRRVLSQKVFSHRIDLCTQIIKLALTMIRNERRTNRRASG